MIIGIDNGISGGLVAIGPLGHIIAKSTMPTVNEGINRIDVVMLKHWIHSLNPNSETVVICESPVGSKSVKAAKSMEASFNSVRAVCLLSGLQFKPVNAGSWQRVIIGKFPAGQSKVYAEKCALVIWPDEDWRASERCKINHSGMIDAGLIAEYWRRKTEF